MPGAGLVQADGLRLPFVARSFDAVIHLGCSLINTDDAEGILAAFRESMRVTRFGGWVVACTSSDFSGRSRGGWVQHTPGFLRDTLARIPTGGRLLRCTLPRLALLHPALVLHRLTDALLRLPVPGLVRTIAFGARVDAHA